MNSTYKIELVKGRNKWYWKLKSHNGRILAHSETYSSRFQAKKTAIALACALGCSIKEEK